MPRPVKCRCVGVAPGAGYFKPRGIPLGALEEVTLSVDEWEALRLADLEGLYQEEAARKMSVSRQTFGNIVDAARRKVADAIIHSKALKIEGGVYRLEETRRFACRDCRHEWELPHGTGRPGECPSCAGRHIGRAGSRPGCRAGFGPGMKKCQRSHI